MINQEAFAAITPIRAEMVSSLRARLEAMGDVIDQPGCPIDFKKINSVHFMRWVILDRAVDLDGNELAPCLLLSTNYDLPLDGHLRELIAKGGAYLRGIYESCVGFTAHTDLEQYLLQHEIPYAAFYVGTRGRSVAQIRDEQNLRNEIQKFLDQQNYPQSTDARVIRAEIQDFVKNHPDLQWALKSEPLWRWHLFFYGLRYVGAGLLLALLALLPAGAVLGPLWFGVPWWTVGVIIAGTIALLGGALWLGYRVGMGMIIAQEKREEKNPLSPAPVGAPVAKLIEREDQIVQNQLSNVVLIKPGRLRLTTLKLVLAAIHFLGRYHFTRGALGGIPTIHFARWIIFDEGRRLLFLSNFDGSWENYLGDFIDKAAVGLTAIWSNTVGCPPARGLFRSGGARDASAFKAWVRENQLFTQVWYSAYDELSVPNINNNSYIRVRLFGPIDDPNLREWLARF